MRYVSHAVGVLALGLFTCGLCEAQTFTFERTLTAPAPTTLDVTTERGAITITAGEPGHVTIIGRVTVRLGWNVPANAVELAKRVSQRPPIDSDDSTVRLHPPHDPVERQAVTVAFEVRVPPEASIVATSDSGAISIEGVDGTVRTRTQSSGVSLAHLGGNVRADSASGAISVSNVRGSLFVTTNSSGIKAHGLHGDLTATSSSGRIEASFAGPAAAEVRTQSSAIILVGVQGALSTTSESGETSITGTPCDDWQVSTGSSRIHLTLEEPNTPFVLDLSTRSGSIDLADFPVQGTITKRRTQGVVGRGGSTIQVSSRSGSIHLHRESS